MKSHRSAVPSLSFSRSRENSLDHFDEQKGSSALAGCDMEPRLLVLQHARTQIETSVIILNSKPADSALQYGFVELITSGPRVCIALLCEGSRVSAGCAPGKLSLFQA
jgi:hypothetical protein